MRTNARSLHPHIWTHKFQLLKRAPQTADRQPLVPDFTLSSEVWDAMLETVPETELVSQTGKMVRWPNVLYCQMFDATTMAAVSDRIRMIFPPDQSGIEWTIEGLGESNDMFFTFDLTRLG